LNTSDKIFIISKGSCQSISPFPKKKKNKPNSKLFKI